MLHLLWRWFHFNILATSPIVTLLYRQSHILAIKAKGTFRPIKYEEEEDEIMDASPALDID